MYTNHLVRTSLHPLPWAEVEGAQLDRDWSPLRWPLDQGHPRRGQALCRLHRRRQRDQHGTWQFGKHPT